MMMNTQVLLIKEKYLKETLNCAEQYALTITKLSLLEYAKYMLWLYINFQVGDFDNNKGGRVKELKVAINHHLKLLAPTARPGLLPTVTRMNTLLCKTS
jgi:hypothetical protein